MATKKTKPVVTKKALDDLFKDVKTNMLADNVTNTLASDPYIEQYARIRIQELLVEPDCSDYEKIIQLAVVVLIRKNNGAVHPKV